MRECDTVNNDFGGVLHAGRRLSEAVHVWSLVATCSDFDLHLPPRRSPDKNPWRLG